MRKRTKMFIAIGIVLIPVAIFVIRTRIPVKYAIKIENAGQYPNCIIVREVWHTGTGWEQIGDEQGYLASDKTNDVYLVGNLPPSAFIGGEHVNSYLCEVANLGQDVYPAIGDAELFDKYEVLEWHPIYPVKRDTLLPLGSIHKIIYQKAIESNSSEHSKHRSDKRCGVCYIFLYSTIFCTISRTTCCSFDGRASTSS